MHVDGEFDASHGGSILPRGSSLTLSVRARLVEQAGIDRGGLSRVRYLFHRRLPRQMGSLPYASLLQTRNHLIADELIHLRKLRRGRHPNALKAPI